VERNGWEPQDALDTPGSYDVAGVVLNNAPMLIAARVATQLNLGEMRRGRRWAVIEPA
jgi:hypothetical protein